MMDGSFFLLGFLALSGAGDAAAGPERLSPGDRREHGVTSPAAPHSYALPLPNDASVRLTVQPRGIDVVVALFGPQGEPLAQFDDAWTDGQEQLDWATTAAGTYRIEVRSKRPNAVGRFEIRVSEPRPATAADRARAAAARALGEGRQLLSDQKAERTREAGTAFEKALSLAQAAGDMPRQALALAGLAGAAAALADYPTAIERAEAALSLWQQLAEVPQQAAALIQMADAFVKSGRFEEALECGEQAATMAVEVGDREGEGKGLLEMSVAQQFLGRTSEAIATDERAVSLARALGDRRSEANALSHLVAIYYGLGEIDRVLALLHQVLPIVRELGDRFLEALNLNSLGTTYNAVGESRRALLYLEQSLALCRELGDRAAESIVLTNIALTHRLDGEYERAAQVLDQSLALKRAIADPQGQAVALNSLGWLQAKGGRLGEARRSFEESLSIPQASKTTRIMAMTNLVSLLLKSGDLERAEDLARQARALAEGSATGLALSLLARVEMARGDLAEADALEEVALSELEWRRLGLASTDLRASLLASAREMYAAHLDLLMARHAAEPAGGFESRAFQTAERGRARSLLDLLAESRANVREGVDADLLERERAVRARLAKANARSVRARAQGGAARDAAEREVETLTGELEQVEAEIRKCSPRYAALTQPEPIALADLQALLDEDTQLLEYSLGPDRSYAWLVGPRSVTSITLASKDAIEDAARRTMAALESERADANATAAELSKLVLAPLAGRLTSRRLVVVADGALQYVPFAALPDPAAGTPLLADHELVSLPSATTLALLRRDRPPRDSARRLVAVLADPVFDPDDERLARTPRPDTPGREAVAPSTRVTRAVEAVGLSGPIPRLPFTRREAEAIQAAAPSRSSLIALGFDASRATIMDAKLADYRVVHFATHGFLNASRPELSGILLSLFDRDGRPQPGFVTASDLFNLKLAADLVVLSGCRTALGRDVKGEGIVGLTRGFMYAGADRVLASLWRVDDAATAALMSRFYSRMLGKEALPPAAALRAAQLDLMKQPRFRHPFFWAGFQLQGDWR